MIRVGFQRQIVIVRVADIIEYVVARDRTYVTDIIHIGYCDFGVGQEVYEHLREVFIRAFRHNPRVEPDIAAFFGYGVVKSGAVVIVGKVERISRVARPGEVYGYFTCRHIFLSAVHFKAVNVGFKRF